MSKKPYHAFRMHLSGDLYHARTSIPGLTQAAVAEKIGVSIREYQFIESGSRIPGAIIFLRLVYFFELDINAYREEISEHAFISSTAS